MMYMYRDTKQNIIQKKQIIKYAIININTVSRIEKLTNVKKLFLKFTEIHLTISVCSFHYDQHVDKLLRSNRFF